MKFLKLSIFAVLFSLFAGCASVKYADKPEVISVQPGKGLVYFYRESSFVGGGVSYKVNDGTVQIGALSNGSFFIANVEPGKHTFSAATESTVSVTIDVEAGKTYYIRGGVTMGVMAGRPQLIQVTESDSKGKLDKLKYTDMFSTTPATKKAKKSKK